MLDYILYFNNHLRQYRYQSEDEVTEASNSFMFQGSTTMFSRIKGCNMRLEHNFTK